MRDENEMIERCMDCGVDPCECPPDDGEAESPPSDDSAELDHLAELERLCGAHEAEWVTAKEHARDAKDRLDGSVSKLRRAIRAWKSKQEDMADGQGRLPFDSTGKVLSSPAPPRSAPGPIPDRPDASGPPEPKQGRSFRAYAEPLPENDEDREVGIGALPDKYDPAFPYPKIEPGPNARRRRDQTGNTAMTALADPLEPDPKPRRGRKGGAE